MDNNEGSSWAALMEEEESSKITPGSGRYRVYDWSSIILDNLPKISETIDGNTKTVVEYSVNENGKIVKVSYDCGVKCLLYDSCILIRACGV